MTLGGAAGGLDLLAGGGAEGVGPDRQLLAELAVAEDLDRVLAGREAGRLERLRGHLGAVVEAVLEVAEVDRLGVRPERLEGHRHLLVRAAQLPHPHVDRVLPALVADVALRARAGALALVAAAGGLAHAGAVPAPDALAVLAGARLRGQVVEADVLGFDPGHQESFPAGSTATR